MISVTQHNKRLKQLPCIVTERTIGLSCHHCHGGSIRDLGFHRGGSQKTNDYLQIPLCWELHLGPMNPEAIGILTWESTVATQVELLNQVSELLGYDVIEYARDYEQR